MQSSLKRFFAGVLIVAMLVTINDFNSLAVTIDTIVSVETKINQEKNKDNSSKYYFEYLNDSQKLLMKGDEGDGTVLTTMPPDDKEKTSSDDFDAEEKTNNDDDKKDDETKIQIDIDTDDDIVDNNYDLYEPEGPLEKQEEEESKTEILVDSDDDIVDNNSDARVTFGETLGETVGDWHCVPSDSIHYKQIWTDYIPNLGYKSIREYTIKVPENWLKLLINEVKSQTGLSKVMVAKKAVETLDIDPSEKRPFRNDLHNNFPNSVDTYVKGFYTYGAYDENNNYVGYNTYIVERHTSPNAPPPNTWKELAQTTGMDPLRYASVGFFTTVENNTAYINFVQNTKEWQLPQGNYESTNENPCSRNKYQVVYDFSDILSYTGQYNVKWNLKDGRWIDSSKRVDLYDTAVGISNNDMPKRGDIKKDGYAFAGWKMYKSESDCNKGTNGTAVDNIAVGTTGNIWLEATWVKSNIDVNDIVYFGKHYKFADGKGKSPIEWQVIDVDIDKKRAYLLSTKMIDAKPYIEGSGTPMEWRDSYLRNWLNGDFYNDSFTNSEKNAIKQVTRTHEDVGQKFLDTNYNKEIDSTDYVSLLSSTDTLKYGEYLKSSATEYAYALDVDMKKLEHYWLRTLCSAGIENGRPVSFHGPYGVRCGDAYVWGTGIYSNAKLGIRPVVWVDINYDFVKTIYKDSVTWNLDGGSWKDESTRQKYEKNYNSFELGQTIYFPNADEIIAPSNKEFYRWEYDVVGRNGGFYGGRGWTEWTVDKEGTVTVTAKWNDSAQATTVNNETCTVTWDLNGGKWKTGSESWEGKSFNTDIWYYTNGGSIPTADDFVAADGYQFDNWTVIYETGTDTHKDTYSGKLYFSSQSNKATVKINWKVKEPDECTVTWDLNGGKWKAGSEKWASAVFKTGTKLYSSNGQCPASDDLIAPENRGFAGWTVIYEDGTTDYCGEDLTFKKVKKATVKASWKVIYTGDDSDYIDIPITMLRESSDNQKILITPDKDKWKSQLGLSEYDNIAVLSTDIDTDGLTKIDTIKYKSADFSGDLGKKLLEGMNTKKYNIDINGNEFLYITGDLLKEYLDFVGYAEAATGDAFIDSDVIAEVWKDDDNKIYVKTFERASILSYAIFCTNLGAFLPRPQIAWDFSDIDVNNFVEEGKKSYEIEWVLDGGQFKDEYKYYETKKHIEDEEFTLPGAETLEAPYRKQFNYWSIGEEEVTTIAKDIKEKVVVKANWSRIVDNFESFSIGKYKQNNQDEELANLEWIILDKVDDKLLLVTKNVIDNQSYDNAGNKDYTNSSIKNWLNNEFYNTAFNDSQKRNIIDNEIFLLSKEKANEYFANNMSRVARATNYAKEVDNDGEVLAVKNANICEYWLAPNNNGDNISYVSFDGEIKEDIEANAKNIGVRPAMWVKANKIEDIKESPLKILRDAIHNNIEIYKGFIGSFFGNLFN